MKAFENIENFSTEKEGSSFAAWLYNIAYHSLLDLLKRREMDTIDEENDGQEGQNEISQGPYHAARMSREADRFYGKERICLFLS